MSFLWSTLCLSRCIRHANASKVDRLGPSMPHHGDAFSQYMSEQPFQYRLDLFNWWATASGFRELRQMAFDLISIPAMSAEAERVFSSTKKLLTPERNALSVESLEIYEVLRNWWLHDIVLQQPNRAEGGEISSDDEDTFRLSYDVPHCSVDKLHISP